MSFYAADLARIHDEGFGDFARAAACELLQHLHGGGLIAELGCGTGITSQIFCANGYDVIGIDISPDMLAIARRRAPQAEFREGSIWDAQLPSCAAVTAIGEIVNYATDTSAGPERLPELFARVFEALEPGGLFMFDFATPGRAGPARCVEGHGWRIESETSETGDMLERRMRIEIDGSSREEVHRLRLYDAGDVLARLDAAGFASEELARYCDFGFWPGYAAFVAARPG